MSTEGIPVYFKDANGYILVDQKDVTLISTSRKYIQYNWIQKLMKIMQIYKNSSLTDPVFEKAYLELAKRKMGIDIECGFFDLKLFDAATKKNM